MKKLLKHYKVVALYKGVKAKKEAKLLKKQLSAQMCYLKYKVVKFGVIKSNLFAVVVKRRKNFVI